MGSWFKIPKPMDTIRCKELLGETFEPEMPENGYSSGDVLSVR